VENNVVVVAEDLAQLQPHAVAENAGSETARAETAVASERRMLILLGHPPGRDRRGCSVRARERELLIDRDGRQFPRPTIGPTHRDTLDRRAVGAEPHVSNRLHLA
jgi:hypothetical protein